MGILFQAQWLANASSVGSMGVAPYYHPGTAILYAPIFVLGLEPLISYKGAMVLNAALAAAIVPMLVKIASFFGYREKWTIAVAALVALWPSYFYTAHYAWAEAAFRFIFLLSVLALIMATETRSKVWATLFGLAIAMTFMTHPRALLIIPVAVTVLVWCRCNQTFSRAQFLLAFLAMNVGVAAFLVVSTAAREALWDADAHSTSGFLLNQLLTAKLITTFAVVFGQTWYQIVASIGIIVPGIVVQLRASDTLRPVSTYVLGSMIGVAAASIGQMLGAEWLDHATYGRYIDGISIVPLWLGLCALLTVEKRPWVPGIIAVVLTVAAGACIVWLWAAVTDAAAAHPNNVAGIGWIFREGASAEAYLFGVSAIVLAVSMALVAMPSVYWRISVVALYVAVAAWQIHDYVRWQAANALSGIDSHVELVRAAGEGPIYWSSEARHVLGLYGLQYALGTRFLLFADGIIEPGALILSRNPPGSDFEKQGDLFGSVSIWSMGANP